MKKLHHTIPTCLLPILAAAALPVLTAATKLNSEEITDELPLPLADLNREYVKPISDAEACARYAIDYHKQEEYALSYRLYARGVERGWITARDYFIVLSNDAMSLNTAYPEKRQTVLQDDGTNDPDKWPVVRIQPAIKTRIWKKKGIAPKRDWLTVQEMTTISASVDKNGIEILQGKATITLEECRRTLAHYDLLRNHVQMFLDGTENRLVREAPGNADLETLRRDLMTLKEAIRVSRTCFVSYTLVSPFLAETVRLRRIARDNFCQMLFNHQANAEKRLDAVSMLALGCHRDILMSCSEDVRIQFCDVVAGLKRISRPVEWEHFKVVTTMLDSYDPAKKCGADAWWE